MQLILRIFLLAFAQGVPRDLPHLALDEASGGSLSATEDVGQALAFRAPHAGTFTITLDSVDFDAVLRVESSGGELLGTDDNSGIETNARIELALEQGETYRVVVAVGGEGSGRFTLGAWSGSRERPVGAAEREAAATFRLAAGESALARQDFAAAAAHIVLAGWRFLDLSRNTEALASFERALGLAREAGEGPTEARALEGLGLASLSLGRPEDSLGHSADALLRYEELGDSAGYGRALANVGSAHMIRGEYEEAREVFEFQRQLGVQEGHRGNEGTACFGIGSTFLDQGRVAEALLPLERAVELLEHSGQESVLRRARATLGTVYLSLGRFEEARQVLQRCVEELEAAGDVSALVTTLTNLGRVDLEQGEPLRALEPLRRAVASSGAGSNPWGEQWARAQLGLTYQRLGRFPEALEQADARLEIVRGLGNATGEAWSRASRGLALSSMGRFAEAHDDLDAALEWGRAHGDVWLQVETLPQLAGVSRYRGDLDRARELYESLLELARRVGQQHAEASALSGLATLASAAGDLTGAEALAREALAIVRSLGRRQNEAWLLVNLADVLAARGQLAEGEALYREASAIAATSGYGPEAFQALVGLADVRHLLGDYRAAQEHFEPALRLAREQASLTREQEALLGLGDVRLHLGDPDGALAYLEPALELGRELGSASQSRALGLLNWAYRLQGSFELARACCRQKIVLAREAGLDLDAARGLGDLARLYVHEGRPAEALPHLEERLALARTMQDPMGESYALSSLARTYELLGEAQRARDFAEQACVLLREIGDSQSLLAPLQMLVRTALRERDPERALKALREAERVMNRPAIQELDGHDAMFLRARHSDWSRLAQDVLALRLARAGEDRALSATLLEEGFVAAGRWKGHALLEGIVEHRRGGRTRAAIRIRGERREALAREGATLALFSRSVAEGATSEELQRLRDEAHEQRSRAVELGRQLAEISPRDAALDLPSGVASAQAREALLDPTTVLIEYVEGQQELAAYALSAEELLRVELGALEPTNALIATYLEEIGDPTRLGSVEAVVRSGSALFEMLLSPVLDALGERSVRTLVVVPTPALAGLPFEALVVPSADTASPPASFGDVTFVLDRYEISYGPSTPVLVELAAAGPRERAGRVLILADPRYAGEVEPTGDRTRPASAPGAALLSRSAPRPDELQRLIKTRDEALALARSLLELDVDRERLAAQLLGLAEARDGSLTTSLYDLCLGAEASPRRLEGDLGSYGVLHFAAHGFVDREHPHNTGIALAWREGDDGFFTIADALELDLDANLVVLSACDTARGEALAGEGVQSMARAFLYAGSRAVVASLWQVADWAAADTMQAFYARALGENRAPGAALREAKRELRASPGIRGVRPANRAARVDASHPYFWAPFVHVGLPR